MREKGENEVDALSTLFTLVYAVYSSKQNEHIKVRESLLDIRQIYSLVDIRQIYINIYITVTLDKV